MEQEKKNHFVLVHGACHGAWCWYKVVARLESAGHKVTAVDLTACGVHPKQLDEVQSIHDYVRPLLEFVGLLSSGERVVLVGHSFGGIALSLAMEAFPEKISVAVFAAAMLPCPSFSLPEMYTKYNRRMSLESMLDTKFTFDQGPEKPPTSAIMGPQLLSSRLYQNCHYEDLKLATMLMREIRIFTNEMLEDTIFTEERFGTVARVYVVCKDDKMVPEDFQHLLIEKAMMNEVKEIEGSDHMVMLSKPEELCAYLLAVAKKYV